ncbi:MAG: hypothetical protein RLZZ396_1951 [Planctomycetota bacterium]|jgi:hypothetical protein
MVWLIWGLQEMPLHTRLFARYHLGAVPPEGPVPPVGQSMRHNGRPWGQSESAGINRLGVGNERVLQ